jgi:hypothetical protein
MNVRIRSYCAEDANAINRIALAAWDQYRSVFSDWPVTASLLAGTASMRKELELLIAEDETQIRGFVGYVAPGRPREKIFKRDWATIRMLCVNPTNSIRKSQTLRQRTRISKSCSRTLFNSYISPEIFCSSIWAAPRGDATLRRLKASAVDFFHLEGVHVHAIHAPDIDGRQLCAGLRMRPDCK